MPILDGKRGCAQPSTVGVVNDVTVFDVNTVGRSHAMGPTLSRGPRRVVVAIHNNRLLTVRERAMVSNTVRFLSPPFETGMDTIVKHTLGYPDIPLAAPNYDPGTALETVDGQSRDADWFATR